MFDDRKIQEEITRSTRDYETLKRNIEILSKDESRSKRMVEAATNDRDRAATSLKKQEQDLERVTKINDEVTKKLAEARLREKDYKQKIDTLERQFQQMKRDLDRGLRR